MNDVDSFRQGGVAFVYKTVPNNDWKNDGVEYQKDPNINMYPIRGSEREHITRRLDVAKYGKLCRVALWTSINPELVAVSYHIETGSMEKDSALPFEEIRHQRKTKEIIVQDKETSNQFLPDSRSHEFPFNSTNVSSALGTVEKTIRNTTDASAANIEKNTNDSQIEPQLESECIDIASEDEDDCIIETETNIKSTEKSFNISHSSENNLPDDKQNSDRNSVIEQRLKIRPMSELTEPDITIGISPVKNTEKTRTPLTSTSISSDGTSKNSLPMQNANTVPRYTINENRGSAQSRISTMCNTTKTNRDNDLIMDVINIDSDDESTNIHSSPNPYFKCDSNKVSTEAPPNKERASCSTQMTPDMSFLSVSKTLDSPNATMHYNEKPSAEKSFTFPSRNLNSTNVTKRKFITTPKRCIDQQPLRQNQYQLAAATKVLDFDSTTSSELNSKIEIEEVSIDGNVSTRFPTAPFIPDHNSISQQNPLEKYNPFFPNTSPNRNKCLSSEVENIIDVSSDEEFRA